MFLIVELTIITILVFSLFLILKREKIFIKDHSRKAKVEEHWPGGERRSHVRFKKCLEVIYSIQKRPRLKANGATVNISEGGMKLSLDEKLPEGTIMNLKVSIPNGAEDTAEIEAQIVWSSDIKEKDPEGKRQFHSGIKYIAIKDPPGKSLVEYIRSLPANLAE